VAWLESSVSVAAELEPSALTLVAADHRRGSTPRCVAAATFDPAAATLSDDIRELRAAHRLPLDAVVILWPHAADAGVTPLDARATSGVVVPKARVIRERVSRLVRAGERVTDVLLPHEAVVRMAAMAGWPAACVLVLQPQTACVVAVQGAAAEATYLRWDTPALMADATESARLLARYQFAARLVPYVRPVAERLPEARVVVCGRFPGLRTAMVPLVEELDREVDVLDAELLGRGAGEAFEPDATAAHQLAWAVALTPTS
jgi:hypothetical protein